MTRVSVMAELPRLLDRLDADGRYALIKLATGAMRVGISARLAKTAFAQAFAVAVEEVEEYWHALAAALRGAVRLGGRRRAAAGHRGDAAVPPVHARAPARGRVNRSISPITSPSGNGTASACRCRTRAAKRGSIRAPATILPAAFPKWPKRWRFDAVLDGELLVRGATRAARPAARRASTRCSSGSGARR